MSANRAVAFQCPVGAGVTVKDPRGRIIGRVVDLVLDPLGEKVLFVLLALDDERVRVYHPMHWWMLEYDPTDGSYVACLSVEQLHAAARGALA